MLPTGQAWVFFFTSSCWFRGLLPNALFKPWSGFTPQKPWMQNDDILYKKKKRIYFTIWQMQSWPLLIKTSSQWRLNIKANDLFYVNDFLLEHKRLFIMDFSVLCSVTKANGVIFSLPGLSFWSKSRCYFYKLNSWNLLQKSNFKELVVELIIKEQHNCILNKQFLKCEEDDYI